MLASILRTTARTVVPCALLLTAACGDAAAPSPAPPSSPPAPAAPKAADGDGPLVPPVVAPEPKGPPDSGVLEEREVEWRRQMDEYGRGLIDSFDRRAYCPTRDAELRFVECVARVRVDGVEGEFKLSYDATREEGERLVVVPDAGADALPQGSDDQVRKFALLSFEGPYRSVVHYLPPLQVLLTRSRDGANRVVTAQPHKHDLQVSYSFDDRDLVVIRGTSVRPQAEIVHYEWMLWRGRYLLSKFWTYGTDASTDFEYDAAGAGVVLMKRALLRKGDHTFDVAFRTERVEVGAPDAAASDPPPDPPSDADRPR